MTPASFLPVVRHKIIVRIIISPEAITVQIELLCLYLTTMTSYIQTLTTMKFMRIKRVTLSLHFSYNNLEQNLRL